jgi:hypothetical protein
METRLAGRRPSREPLLYPVARRLHQLTGSIVGSAASGSHAPTLAAAALVGLKVESPQAPSVRHNPPILASFQGAISQTTSNNTIRTRVSNQRFDSSRNVTFQPNPQNQTSHRINSTRWKALTSLFSRRFAFSNGCMNKGPGTNVLSPHETRSRAIPETTLNRPPVPSESARQCVADAP